MTTQAMTAIIDLVLSLCIVCRPVTLIRSKRRFCSVWESPGDYTPGMPITDNYNVRTRRPGFWADTLPYDLACFLAAHALGSAPFSSGSSLSYADVMLSVRCDARITNHVGRATRWPTWRRSWRRTQSTRAGARIRSRRGTPRATKHTTLPLARSDRPWTGALVPF